MPRMPQSTRRQSTLSFTASSKISKAVAKAVPKAAKTPGKAPASAEVQVPPAATPATECPGGGAPVGPPLSNEISLTNPLALKPYFQSEESSARDLRDTRINSYYRSLEASRKAPPVHRSKLPQHEQILRHFDLSSQYGPCIGITRLNRWKRAQALGLKPPIEVLRICLEVEENGQAKDRRDERKAWVDEFLSSRDGEE